MGTLKSDRLMAARKKAGYDSASAAADAFGWKVAGYIHHENGTRGFGPDAASKYGRAFRVKAGWLLGLDGVDEGASAIKPLASASLSVAGRVAAGVWRDVTDSAAIMEIDVAPPVPDARRFGVVVEGASMDLHYEEGTVLDCVGIHSVGIQPQNGDHVIVERIKPDGLRECTVKEFAERDGEYFLVPRSKRPDFKEVCIGKPTEGQIDGDEVRVIGFVVSNIPPSQLALLKRMGKVRNAE